MDDLAPSAPDLRPLLRVAGIATAIAAAAVLVPDPSLRAFTLPFLLSAALMLAGALILDRLVRKDQPRAMQGSVPSPVSLTGEAARPTGAAPPSGPAAAPPALTSVDTPARRLARTSPDEPGMSGELVLGPEQIVPDAAPQPVRHAAPAGGRPDTSQRLGVARRSIVTLPQRRRAMLLIETALCGGEGAPEPIARARRMALGAARRLDLDLELLEHATRLLARAEPGADTWLLPLAAGTPAAARAALQGLAETAAAVSPKRRLVLLFDELPDPTGWRSLRELRLPVSIGLGLATGASLAHEPETLARFGIGILVLDREALPTITADVDPDPLRLARLRALRAAGIAVVLDGLDLETQLRDRLDWPIELGAGLLFGAPEELG
jgi:hypothetical protein